MFALSCGIRFCLIKCPCGPAFYCFPKCEALEVQFVNFAELFEWLQMMIFKLSLLFVDKLL